MCRVPRAQRTAPLSGEFVEGFGIVGVNRFAPGALPDIGDRCLGCQEWSVV